CLSATPLPLCLPSKTRPPLLTGFPFNVAPKGIDQSTPPVRLSNAYARPSIPPANNFPPLSAREPRNGRTSGAIHCVTPPSRPSASHAPQTTRGWSVEFIASDAT